MCSRGLPSALRALATCRVPADGGVCTVAVERVTANPACPTYLAGLGRTTRERSRGVLSATPIAQGGRGHPWWTPLHVDLAQPTRELLKLPGIECGKHRDLVHALDAIPLRVSDEASEVSGCCCWHPCHPSRSCSRSR